MAINDINPFKQSASSKGFLNNTNRSVYDTNKEFVTSGIWEVNFTKIPAAIYFPGNDVISAQIRSVNTPNPMPAKILEWNHRDFIKYQPSSRVSRNGDVTLNFTDFEDGSIIAWINSWISLQSDPETNLGLRSEFLKCDLTLTRLNTSGNPINEIICKSGYVSNVKFNNEFTNQQDVIAEQGFTLRFEHITFNQLNI